MSELDKKMQKNPPDLVQSVLEAMEKRSVERVDLLITNAFRQLKTSRFKPDQSICNSLTYLARVCPKAFSQSSALKELLKTHIKRDSGPSNIKGTKNDFIVPVLAANILLACCDSVEVRSIILARVEQWISTNQKLNELVQHLLAILCIRCNDDPQTIKTLIETRNHWYQFLDSNQAIYGPVSKGLALSVRELLLDATSCETLTENVYFLTKHDPDILGLSTSISKLITRRPTTVESMLSHPDLGDQLKQMLISVYDKLFAQLNPALKKEDMISPVFIEITVPTPGVVAIEKSTMEAIIVLISSPAMTHLLDSSGPLVSWLHAQKISPNMIAYEDAALALPYEIPTRLLQQLISSGDLQVDLALKCAKPCQLLELVHLLGLEASTLKKIFEKLVDVKAEDVIKSRIKELTYISDLLEYYQDMGVSGASRLMEVVSRSQDVKDLDQKPEVLVKVKAEPV